MNVLRKLLFPIVPIYFFVTWLRNKMYDWGIKKSKAYDFPVIAIGNLSVGGTGKSPMVEYLITILKKEKKVATLSRGYKRETKGFQWVETHSNASDVGDEPLQFKTKFPDILVGVDADRRTGVERLRSSNPTPEIIILDDAYQHRKVKAGFYILLTAYGDLYCDDIVLPTGDLREPKNGAHRADIIIVSKCPKSISEEEREDIKRRLKVKEHQSLFFTTIAYGTELISTNDIIPISFFKTFSFTLVTGIANPKPLVAYYKSLGLEFEHISFTDHHNFSGKEINELKKHKYIITTEKDYMRFLATDINKDQLWYQPITVNFVDNEDVFVKRIFEYLG